MEKTHPIARLKKIIPPAQHRRKRERKPCTLDASYRKLSARSNYFWTCRIWDISLTGISLQMKEELEKGTELEIEILKGVNVISTLIARVAHATEHKNNTWVIGCDLDCPLDEEELAALA